MFSGINEILLITAVVLAIIFIPRMIAPRHTARPGAAVRAERKFTLSGRQRLAILSALFWIAFWAVYCEPWKKEWQLFLYVGAGPVMAVLGLWWALNGKRKNGA